jgi:hypothetical protein
MAGGTGTTGCGAGTTGWAGTAGAAGALTWAETEAKPQITKAETPAKTNKTSSFSFIVPSYENGPDASSRIENFRLPNFEFRISIFD